MNSGQRLWMSRQRGGFTLIELMVVIAIMATLATMIIVVSTKFLDAKNAKSKVIVATVMQAIELSAANSGSTFSPQEHPLAGSKEKRFKFISSTGSILSASGIAVKGRPRNYKDSNGVSHDLVTASLATCLLDPEDRYADSRVPGLFGLKRKYIGVLGAMQAAVTYYMRLPVVDINLLRSQNAASLVDIPEAIGDNFFAQNPIDTCGTPTKDQLKEMANGQDIGGQRTKGVFLLPLSNKNVIDQILGLSGMQGELAGLGALKTAFQSSPAGNYPGTLAENTYVTKPAVNPYGESAKEYITKAESISIPLVLFKGNSSTGSKTKDGQTNQKDDLSSGAEAEDEWKPGFIKVGGKWRSYRLPGLALYDAFDNELLITVTSNGKWQVISAGVDRCFRWNPGKNKTIDTAAADKNKKGDDTDGTIDNIGERIEDE